MKIVSQPRVEQESVGVVCRKAANKRTGHEYSMDDHNTRRLTSALLTVPPTIPKPHLGCYRFLTGYFLLYPTSILTVEKLINYLPAGRRAAFYMEKEAYT